MYQFEVQRLLAIFGSVERIESSLKLADLVLERTAQTDYGRIDFELSQDKIAPLAAELDQMYADCKSVDLQLCCHQLDRLRAALIPSSKFRDVAALWSDLKNRITDELRGRITLSIPREHAEQYQNQMPFGVEVAAKFERVLTDMQEASKCLALDRSTACVFHLMRVMEYSVQRFGRRLGLKLTDLKTWQKILDDLNAPIRQMPERKAREKRKKENYAAAHAHLFNVKLAWRNPVMHPKATYTPAEARDVFNHVGSFLRHLATLI